MEANPQGVKRAWGLPADRMVWRTDSVRKSERFSYYREAICEALMDLAPETDDSAGFDACVEAAPLGDGALSWISASPHRVYRTSREIAHSSTECYYLNLILAGECQIRQSGNEVRLRPGEVAVFDSAEPFALHHAAGQEIKVVVFWVPRERLDRLARPGARFDALHLSEHPRTGALIAGTANALAENAMAFTESEADVLFESLLNLVLLCADTVPEDRGASDLALGSATLQAILRHIETSIGDPGLSVEQAARHAGVSRRYVHKLFERLETSFTRYVIDRRLARIHSDLMRPERCNLAISSIAYRWGFSDLSHFNKAFKAKYAATPGDLRRSCGAH